MSQRNWASIGERVVTRVPGTNGITAVVDAFGEGATCLFLRLDARAGPSALFVLDRPYEWRPARLGGWLLLPQNAADPCYWIPRPAAARRADQHGRVLEELEARPTEFRIDSDGAYTRFEVPATGTLDLVVWKFSDGAREIASELATASAITVRGAFLWGSHARFNVAADLYRHLIHGAVYDVRWAWPHQRRCFSENEAHALYVALSGFERITGKRLYRLLQRQIVLSVVARQDSDGAWRHGTWTDGMECHYRLHSSGMHLLLDEYGREGSASLRDPLERAAAFLARQTDAIDAGRWLLHDSLELSAESMNKAPFTWVRSRVLGKSPSNMLVLNTHLDSLIALHRYQAAYGDSQHAALLESGERATARVLALRSAERLYRMLFAVIRLTLLPTTEASRLALPKRALKRLGWKYLVPLLPAIKSRWPRLVMPGGYIDRELSLHTWAFDYHAINVMDLLRYHRAFADPASLKAAQQGIAFMQDVSLRARWAEVPGKEYAVGFCAEALYHACTLSDDLHYRAALADVILQLVNMRLGIPPSLLGVNAEAVPWKDQRPSPTPEDLRLVVANLSRSALAELLVVNTHDEPLPVKWDRMPEWCHSLNWSDARGKPVTVSPVVPGRSFLLARSQP